MEEFLKQKLLEKRPKAYSLIVQHYSDKIQELGRSVFKDWLCEELAIEESKINMASLYSATRRMQVKNKGNKKTISFQSKLMNGKSNEIQTQNFFSNPDTLPTSNNNFAEM
jgi:hypothetical protein